MRQANSCWVRSLIAVACFLAVATRASDSWIAASLGLLGLGQGLGPDPGRLGDVGLQPLGRLVVVLGGLGQQLRGLGLSLVVGLLQLGHRLLALGGDLLPDLGGLALDRAAQVLGVEVGVLPRGLGLVVGLTPQRLCLPTGGGDQRLGLGLGLVDLGLELAVQLLPQLVDLGDPAGLDRVTLPGRGAAQAVGLAPGRPP